MKQKEVLRKIGVIIKELNEQYEYFEASEEEIIDLEVELFSANANFLTDHIEIFRKLNFQLANAKKAVEKKELPPPEKFFEPVVQHVNPPVIAPEIVLAPEPEKPIEIEPVITDSHEEQPVPHIDLTSGAAEDTYSFIREEPETIRHELILDENLNWDDEDEDLPLEDELVEIVDDDDEDEDLPIIAETPIAPPVEEEKPFVYEPAVIIPPVAEEVKPAPVVEEIKAPPVIIAKPVERPKDDDVLTINQKIMAQMAEKTSYTDNLAGKSVTDLKQAINLNDKLLYIKDLFNGYNLAYSEAIDILNRFKTFDEASRFLSINYSAKNNWDSKPETVEKFYALLKRRYS